MDVPKPLVPLQAGEYDLVNISLIGHDPISGRTFSECYDEFRLWNNALATRQEKCPWWNFAERIRIAREATILEQRLGAPLAWAESIAETTVAWESLPNKPHTEVIYLDKSGTARSRHAKL